MNKQELLIKFNNGTLSEKESDMLETMFINDSLSIDEFEIYQNLDTHLESNETNISLDHRIQDLISEEITKENTRTNQKHWFGYLPLPIKLIFPVLLLLCGFFAGKSWQIENKDQLFVDIDQSKIKNFEMANDLLYHPSSSQRLSLVNNASNLNVDQERVIRLLFMSLNHDRSSSVRMAAVDALMQYSDMPIVREGLIKAINQQDASIMIQYLTEALNIIGEKINPNNAINNLKKSVTNSKIKPLDKIIY